MVKFNCSHWETHTCGGFLNHDPQAELANGVARWRNGNLHFSGPFWGVHGLINIQKAIENCHLWWFSSSQTVSLPEGKCWHFFSSAMEHLRMQRGSQGQRLSRKIRLWEAWLAEWYSGRNPAPVDRWFVSLFLSHVYIYMIYIYMVYIIHTYIYMIYIYMIWYIYIYDIYIYNTTFIGFQPSKVKWCDVIHEHGSQPFKPQVRVLPPSTCIHRPSWRHLKPSPRKLCRCSCRSWMTEVTSTTTDVGRKLVATTGLENVGDRRIHRRICSQTQAGKVGRYFRLKCDGLWWFHP